MKETDTVIINGGESHKRKVKRICEKFRISSANVNEKRTVTVKNRTGGKTTIRRTVTVGIARMRRA